MVERRFDHSSTAKACHVSSENSFTISKIYLQSPTIVVLLYSFRTPNERNRLKYGIICTADYLLPTPEILYVSGATVTEARKHYF